MAIEIKRTQAGQSFINRPVGVVRTASGSDKIYAQKAQQYSQLGAFAFDLAKEEQITRGTEYANLARVRNSDGEVEYKALPFSLGRYGQEAANQILSRKYLTALKQDQQDAAIAIKSNSGNDPVRFEDGFNTWIESRAKLIEQSGGSEVLSGFIESASIYKKEIVNGIVLENLEIEKRQSSAIFESVARAEAVDMKNAYLANQYDDANALYQASLNSITSSFVSGGENRDTYNKAVTALNIARLEGIVGQRFENQPPQILKALELELRGRPSGLDILEKNPDILDAFNSLPDSTQTTFVNGLSNQATKQDEFNKQILSDLEATRNISFGSASSEDMTNFLSKTSYNDYGDVIGVGLDILRNPEAASAAVGYMKTGGALEPKFKSAVVQLLNGRSFDLERGAGADLAIINTAISALEGDRSVGGKTTLRTDMGLSDVNIGRLTYLRDAISQGPASFERAMNIFADPKGAADLANTKLDEDFRGKDIFESAEKIIAKQSSLQSIPENIRRETKNVLIDALITQESASDAITKYEEYINTTYVKSDYMEGLNSNTPELRFPELTQEKDHRGNFYTFALESFKGNRNVTSLYSSSYEAIGVNTPFNDHTNKLLSLTRSSNLTYEDVHLVVDKQRTDDNRVVYFMRDKKTREFVLDQSGMPATIDSNQFKNLVKLHKAKDAEYASRYTFGTDEAESFLRSFVGLAGVPVTTAQEILRKSIGALPDEFGLPRFEVPAIGSSEQLKAAVTEAFKE